MEEQEKKKILERYRIEIVPLVGRESTLSYHLVSTLEKVLGSEVQSLSAEDPLSYPTLPRATVNILERAGMRTYQDVVHYIKEKSGNSNPPTIQDVKVLAHLHKMGRTRVSQVRHELMKS